jgi:nicotinamide-nucleotide amidase
MYPTETIGLAREALDYARGQKMRICTVETVTSGLLAAALTSVSGSSEIFERGFILYHTSAKATGLGVSSQLSESHGAVSSPVTQALADGGLEYSDAGICVAITGYAGPTGGNEQDPVGTCYIGVSSTQKEKRIVERFIIKGDREAVRLGAVNCGLELLNKVFLEIN